jgi:hypothetical protein
VSAPIWRNYQPITLALTDTAAHSIVGAQGTGKRIYVRRVVISTTATSTITLSDGTATIFSGSLTGASANSWDYKSSALCTATNVDLVAQQTGSGTASVTLLWATD